MNTIGFQNFRGFQSFPEIDLGDITLLVGGNNSGKSTLVKALLLCMDNIRSFQQSAKRNIFPYPQFRFDANEWHDMKINLFKYALCNKASDNTIRFVFTMFDNVRFEIHVQGDKDEDQVTGDVVYVKMEFQKEQRSFTVNYKEETMTYSVMGDSANQVTLLQHLEKDLEEAKRQLEASVKAEDLETISTRSEQVTKLEQQIAIVRNEDEGDGGGLKEDAVLLPNVTSYTVHLEEHNEFMGIKGLPFIIGNFEGYRGLAKPEEDADDYEEKYSEWEEDQKAYLFFRNESGLMTNCMFRALTQLSAMRVEYISAHAASQNAIYNIADRNDYFAKVIHRFYQCHVSEGDPADVFLRTWMEKFGIGTGYEIKQEEGVAYQVSIFNEDGESVRLGDKGMGSIQIMGLLFHCAAIISEFNLAEGQRPNEMYPIVLIEEPEQNLHPRLQSLLAELFFEMNKMYHCRFIVETHSEYLIRKTQVIVAEENYVDEKDLKDNNPFMVYYLPSDGSMPYDMHYRTDGKFANEFGSGFFDTASNLAFELF